MKKQNENKPHIFGVRHFSPAGAYYVRKYLDEVQPKVVLIEAPSDFTDLMDKITAKSCSSHCHNGLYFGSTYTDYYISFCRILT